MGRLGEGGVDWRNSLVEIQKQIEEAAKTINYSTKAMRHSAEESDKPRESCCEERKTNGKKSSQKPSETSSSKTCCKCRLML